MDLDSEYTAQEPEMLATRRSRRSTAGNRMATVMAEVALDGALQELDDDRDFLNANDEQDVFESDFASTDEEADRQTEETGEAEVVQEERRIRKANKSRLEKATAAAHAKQRVTFNKDIQLSTAPKSKSNPKIAIHTLVQKSRVSKTRTSKRMHTVLNTTATVTRLKESELKKAAQPRKMKTESRAYTQGELIALALDTEEGNIRDHRDYLKNEEEKRKRARVVRATIEGPKLRWISRAEEIKVPALPPTTVSNQANGASSLPASYRSIYGPPGTLFTPTTYNYSSGSLVKTGIASSSTSSQAPEATSSYTLQSYSPFQYQVSPFPVWPPNPQLPYYHAANTMAATSTSPASSAPQLGQQTSSETTSTTQATSLASQPTQIATQQQSGPAQTEYKTETTTKNYVVHELSQHKGAPKPTWTDNMKAMFGDHVKWEEVKVFVGKNRPLSRPRQTCPITGLPANYLDPRSGVPFADRRAYKILGQLLEHEYVWNPSTGSYLGSEELGDTTDDTIST